MIRHLLLTLMALTAFSAAQAQQNVKDSTVSCVGFGFSYAAQMPGGDLALRFGNNSSAGASFWGKTKKNYWFGMQWGYMFGQNLRETGILDSIATSDGLVINKEGKYSDVQLYQRGFTLSISAGKIFPKAFGLNKNSGLMLTGGVGYIQHRIRIIDNGSLTPPLSDQYLKGYDRLTGGFLTQEFLGYWFQGRKKRVNFFAGIECMQGFTRSMRSWDYDLMRPDTQQRVDLLWGIRVGWNIPIYRRPARDYYYY
ncbi:MAG: hypothetical protein IM638_16115 [Bacteroidetes bacterium]|nr:hypothetical protein [Bacteroidota bacterium]